MEERKTNKKFVFWQLIITTIIGLAIIVFTWLGYGSANLTTKIIVSLAVIIILIISYLAYNHQKKTDAKQLNNQLHNS